MRFLFFLLVGLVVGVAAAAEAPLELPQVQVHSARPPAFTVRGVVQPDGSKRLLIVRAISATRDLLYGDFRIGDEVVKIDGVDLASSADAFGSLRAGSKVAVRRRVALQRYELIDVECRLAPPTK